MSSVWDERYGSDEYAFGREPNGHLQRSAGLIAPGAAVLLPGDGEGRNGVWLAEQGFRVLSVDQSTVGLDKARRLAAQKGVSIDTAQADLLRWNWPVGCFGAVVSIFVHFAAPERQTIAQAMIGALAPGGLLIFEAFRPEQLERNTGGPKDAALLYRAADLAHDFAALSILSLEEAEQELDEGPYHHGPGAVVRMVARKEG